MESEQIKVKSDGTGREQALAETERTAAHLNFGKKEALRLRLLAEETLGMVQAITGDFEALFWLETLRGKTVELHLRAVAGMDYDKKQELIAASSSGKNEASRGFMGMVRDLFERGMHSFEEVNRMQLRYGGAPLAVGTLGAYNMDGMAVVPYTWSLEQFRENLEAERRESEAAEEARDELEKSIVASIADDVRVFVEGNRVELTIIYHGG